MKNPHINPAKPININPLLGWGFRTAFLLMAGFAFQECEYAAGVLSLIMAWIAPKLGESDE